MIPAAALDDQPWQTQPAPYRFLLRMVEELSRLSPRTERFAARLLDEAGIRLHDCLDHLVISPQRLGNESLVELGFERKPDALPYWVHGGGMFPKLVVSDKLGEALALKVESVIDFLAAHALGDESVSGLPGAPLREAAAWRENGVCLKVVERHGEPGFAVENVTYDYLAAMARHAEAFRLRKRVFFDPEAGFSRAEELVAAATKELGRDRACDLFFAAEREYWQRRNHAARVQKARQDSLGIGWANHDHHTYRSSREWFHRLIRLLRLLGFATRERFYAGREAGWGAQVLEQPHCGLVVFADVDLAPEEVAIDFASEPLEPSARLGTVGLWCKLHGEAVLEAGLHHLECQFDFDRARSQLRRLGVESMNPFTDFPHLKQCFTVGERWIVAEDRLQAALDGGWISPSQAEQFRTEGAIGSHLEILERNEGYKGFNQTGISQIITETDPRRTAELVGRQRGI